MKIRSLDMTVSMRTEFNSRFIRRRRVAPPTQDPTKASHRTLPPRESFREPCRSIERAQILNRRGGAEAAEAMQAHGANRCHRKPQIFRTLAEQPACEQRTHHGRHR